MFPIRGSRFRAAALLCFVVPVIGISSTGPSRASESEEIEALLRRLVRVSSLYRDSALQFECRETIGYTVFGKGKKFKKFAYLFVYDDEEGFSDYRLTRRQIKNEETLEEARVNDWLGWFWIDTETSQILKVVAYQAESASDWVQLQSDLVRARYEADVFHRGYILEKVTVEFGVERNGMRFPSRVDIVLERYDLWGGRPEGNRRPKELARTVQNFTDYRFFEIKTAEEIGKHIAGDGG
jgi:hypothetical protein